MRENIIRFGSKKIPFQLVRSDRKTLGITVTPDLDVIVRAPFAAEDKKIDSLLYKRAPWILKHLHNFLMYHPKYPPRQYIGGESHLYLGRQYLLRVYLGKTESVRLIGREMRVVCRNKKDVKKIVDQWYKYMAHIRINQIAESWIKEFGRYGVSPSAIQLRKMSNRWGSCSSTKSIVLNTELIKAPKGSIEGVIVHELCHLVHRNHSKKFYELQSKVMPEWEKWKERLEKVMA